MYHLSFRKVSKMGWMRKRSFPDAMSVLNSASSELHEQGWPSPPDVFRRLSASYG